VVRARQYSELGVWEQAEHQHGVFGADDIVITNYDQCGSVDRLNFFGGPALEIQHSFHALGEECRQIFWVGGHSEVRLSQFCWHVVQFCVLERLPESGVASLPVEHGRLNNQLSRHVRVSDSDLEGNVASVAVAEEVSLRDFEIPEQTYGVLRRLLEGKRTIYISSVTVSLLLEGDDLPGLCKGRQNLSERCFDRRSAAVEKEQGWSLSVHGSVDLVIHLEPVHRRVSAPNRRRMGAYRRCATRAESQDSAEDDGGDASFFDHVLLFCLQLFQVFDRRQFESGLAGIDPGPLKLAFMIKLTDRNHRHLLYDLLGVSNS